MAESCVCEDTECRTRLSSPGEKFGAGDGGQQQVQTPEQRGHVQLVEGVVGRPPHEARGPRQRPVDGGGRLVQHVLQGGGLESRHITRIQELNRIVN